MKIGFTGTRDGMTPKQKQQVQAILSGCRGAEFHHGDCVGADIEAEAIALACGFIIVVHPPTSRQFRAMSKQPALAPRDYLTRNRDIVAATNILIATPKEVREMERGGTWSTWRFAKQQGKPTTLIFPNGELLLAGYDTVGAQELGV
jgi:hypothetical protein